MDYETKCISRKNIRAISTFIRKYFKIRTIRFPVMKVLDKLVDEFEDILVYEILPDDKFENNVMAFIETDDYCSYSIKIRESVYNGALEEKGDCLGFINHEISHFILMYIFGMKPIVNCNIGTNNIIPTYKSMEWQAKALCGELMIPFEKCKNRDLDYIIKVTGSSREQALYFKRNVCKTYKKKKNVLLLQ